MIRDTSQPDPGIVLELLEAFRRSKTMFAAVSLGIFDNLEEEPKSLAGLAEALDLNPDALERLLDACIGLHLLDRQGDALSKYARHIGVPLQAEPIAADRLHRLFQRRDVEALGQPRGRGPGGHSSMAADVRLGRPDLLAFLPDRGGPARIPDGDAWLRADQLARTL